MDNKTDKVGFSTGVVLIWFNIWKSIQLKREKDKNHMITIITAGKAIDKNPTSLPDKNSQQTTNRWEFL